MPFSCSDHGAERHLGARCPHSESTSNICKKSLRAAGSSLAPVAHGLMNAGIGIRQSLYHQKHSMFFYNFKMILFHI